MMTSIGSFMSPLDSSIVSVSLPSITSNLNMDYTMAIWVPTAYLAALTVMLLSIGRLSDMRGRKPFFISGFAIFTSASFLCSISSSGLQLIAFRTIQGAGAAFMASTSPAILTDVFPGKERGKALGINTMAVYVGLALGPSLGGLLTSAVGWRSIFYINIPIGLFVIAMSLWKLHEPLKASQKRFDLTGALSFSLGIVPLLLALTLGGIYGWNSPLNIGLLILGGVFLVMFVLFERKKGDNAMLDVSMFSHNRLFSAANISALLNYTSFFGVSFFISFYLQRTLGYSPLQAGVILFIMPVSMAILSPISGWLSDRIGSRILASSGMAVISVGLLLTSTLSLSSSSADVAARLFIVGLGMGLFSSPNTSAVMGSVEKDQRGIASGTLATMRFLGQSLSLALMSAIFATFISSSVLSALFVGINPSTLGVATEEFVEAMQRAFIIAAIISAAGVFTSFIRGKQNISKNLSGIPN
jgi:EmrB/QacA subfamily drug resistance transporter